MRLLLTGADGQLGKAIQQECLNQSIPCKAYNKHTLDITDPKSISVIFDQDKPTHIINCAAYNAVDDAEDSYGSALDVNRDGVVNLIKVAHVNDIPLVHFSTDYVFDGNCDIMYTEDDETNPISKYGESKLSGEEAALDYHKLSYVIRLSWVFGDGDNFCRKVINWAKNNKQIKIVDDQISSPTYTVDAAKVILQLIKTGKYGLYQFTNRGFCSRYVWAKYIINVLGLNTEVLPAKSKDFNTKAKRPNCSVMSTSKIRKLLNIKVPTWQDATSRFLLTK